MIDKICNHFFFVINPSIPIINPNASVAKMKTTDKVIPLLIIVFTLILYVVSNALSNLNVTGILISYQ